MAFDRNPRTTPADQYIAGKTTETVVAAIASAIRAGTEVHTAVSANDALLALDARFLRKALARAERSEAE